jgi:D-alanyl-D-alanine carboxypeptidase
MENFSPETRDKLQVLLNRSIDKKRIHGTTFAIRSPKGQWQGASGDLSIETPFFIASSSKLFTTALILEGQKPGSPGILDKRVAEFIPLADLQGLARIGSRDFSETLTIGHLLAHTSGIADYFQGKMAGGNSLEKELLQGNDQPWSYEQCLERSRLMGGAFEPGRPGKALYSDTNFQLLGKILEVQHGVSYAQLVANRIAKPLGLSETYVYSDPEDQRPHPLYYKDKPLLIPRAMTSFGPDGGIVSTSGELMKFLEAFFTGAFFDPLLFNQLENWNPIFFPMQSGIGLHLFRLPWYFDPFRKVPACIGHSGLSGTVAFFNRKNQIFITGTVNQVAHPDASFRLMIKLLLEAIR